MKASTILAGVLALATAAIAAAQSSDARTLRPLLWQGMPSSQIGEINVFRRFSTERTAAMTQFYGDVLGLTALPSSAAGGGQMIRYPIGASEVKLFPSPASEPNTAAAAQVVGMRVLTFFFADEAALAARFREHGFTAPRFTQRSDGARVALAQDPDGEWVELVVSPGAAAQSRFEIGIVVSNLEESRAFYRDFMGLDEQGPIEDSTLGAVKYVYKHEATTINLWSSAARDKPADTATGGVQYIVRDVVAIDEVAQARGAAIDRPLSAPGQMRTIWLKDPDGVSNYFAQFAGNDNAPPR